MREPLVPSKEARRPMDVWESDAWALEIRRRAGVDPDAIVRPSELARRVPGIVGVHQAKGLRLVADGELERTSGGWRIAVRAGIPAVRARFAVLHEIAELVIGDAVDEGIEDACNAVAASLAMPRRPFEHALRVHGVDPHRLAAIFIVTATAAALRIGEVTCMPVAAITPRRVWIRGREIAWPSERELRHIALVGHPAIRPVALGRRRVGFFVDGHDVDEIVVEDEKNGPPSL